MGLPTGVIVVIALGRTLAAATTLAALTTWSDAALEALPPDALPPAVPPPGAALAPEDWLELPQAAVINSAASIIAPIASVRDRPCGAV
jgi:hypothetical protein